MAVAKWYSNTLITQGKNQDRRNAEERKILVSEGKKHDQDKIRFDLIPVEAIEALAKVLKMGSEKYGDNNWREGIKYHRVYRAAQHHLQEFWGDYPDKDDESGLPHLYHALCNIAFLITYEDNKERYRTFDDRYVVNNAPDYPDLTKMSHPEACEHLEVGMRVKLINKAKSHERGWVNWWTPYMSTQISGVYTIKHISVTRGVAFGKCPIYGFPAFVLEIISGPEDTE